MTLGQMQELHLELSLKLMQFVLEKPGHKLRYGQTTRTQEEANVNSTSGAGIKNSLHLIGLAIDLKLFINGKYMTDSLDYVDMGAYWKSLHSLARWGGDFRDKFGKPKPDGNHFSLEWQGVK